MESVTFSKWRSFFWPVQRSELKKVGPMLLMLFLITFNYTILRDVKDALVITAPGSGAEVIPFIKVWCVVPSAILFMLLYAKLSNILTRQWLFYATLAPFLLFFTLFAFLLYPLREAIQPTVTADALQSLLPEGFRGLIALYRNWTLALFYVVAELWSTVMLTLVFWGFANQITRLGEAKRFYPLFGLGGNIAPFFAGLAIVHLVNNETLATEAQWEHSLQLLLMVVTGVGVLVGFCYSGIQRFAQQEIPPQERAKAKKKLKMSLKESLLFLAQSRYIRLLAVLVIAYGMAINLIEVTWKHQAKLQFPQAQEYSTFMGYVSMSTGILAPLMALFIGGNLIRRFGWTFAALTTPIVLLVTGVGFFLFVLLKEESSAFVSWTGVTPLLLAVLMGAMQNILCKSTKYSLFDPTKEMVYIPLDEESKVKGKAAVDVVGSRLGKSGGSLLQQGLLFLFGSLQVITPYVGVLLLGIIFLWVLSVRRLGRHFGAHTAPKPEPAPATVHSAP